MLTRWPPQKTRSMDYIKTFLEQQPLMALFLTIGIGYRWAQVSISRAFRWESARCCSSRWLSAGSRPRRRRRRMVGTLGLRCSSTPSASSTASSSSSA